jgi:lysophospholipase L1-like esterase
MRGALKRLLFSLLPLCFIFFTLETAQRIRYFSRNYDRAWLLYGLVPDRNPTTRVKVIAVRPPAFTIEPGNFRTVICLGSSTTAGIYNDPLHKYPYLLNRLLESRRPADAPFHYRVINYGVTGGSSEGYEMAIERMFEVVTPDVVIMYTGYSDIFVKDVNDIYQTFQARLGPVWTALEHRSLLLLTLKEKYIFWKENQRNSYLQDASKYGRLENGFRDNIRKSVRALKARGVKVILIPEVLIAKRFGAVTGDFTDYAAKYQHIPGILKQVAADEGVELLTAQDAFDNDDYKTYFVDPAHLTNQGNEVLSRLIFDRSKTLQELVSH